MALCASCGTGENEIRADKNGWCGKCHKDNWVQWEDFFIQPGLMYGHLKADYWREIMNKINIDNVFDLMEKVIDSEVDHYSRGEGLTWIFKYKIADGIKEIIKK